MVTSNLTSFLAEGKATYTDGGAVAEYTWIIVVLPFLAALLITFLGKYLPLKGAEIALATIGFIFTFSSYLLYLNITEGVASEFFINVGSIGTFDLEFGWVVDGLSIMMYFVVGTVASLVFIYATNYMQGEVRYTFFFTSLTLFVGSMLVLVSSPTLLQLLIGWELVGVCSYLLIGHYWEKKENSSAAMKAFITNKIADIGLMIGIIILALSTGTMRISEILYQSTHDYESLKSVAYLAGVLLFIGAMGKSAQFPFHVWLPDAMAGPTPVSALMHAATMVTAGVYLLARMFPFYQGMASQALDIVLLFGVITLFAAGLIAIVQDDLKKVLAYSTVSQLGYMVAAIGSGAYTAALFHLWTHAFFKALLFLGAGSVIHAFKDEQMGGLRKEMPRTYTTFIIPRLICVLPPLAGFFSKDEILASLNHGGYNIYFAIAVAGAFITAFYMTRAVVLTFFGEYRGNGHPHESDSMMTTPLIVLAGFAVVAGWVNIPGIYTGFTDWVTTRKNPIVEYHPESFDYFALSSGLLAGLAGIGLAYYVYQILGRPEDGDQKIKVEPIWNILENKYYLDDLYFKYIINPTKSTLANIVDRFKLQRFHFDLTSKLKLDLKEAYEKFDQGGIDKALNISSSSTDALGARVKLLQTGKAQQYIMYFLSGVIVISLLILLVL